MSEYLEKSVPGQGTNRCKGPEAEANLVGSRDSMEAIVFGGQSGRWDWRAQKGLE